MSRLTILIWFVAGTIRLLSQVNDSSTVAGVYGTYSDFVSGKLSYSINCEKERQKIKLHDFFEKPYFDVYANGSKMRLRKDSTFGYRNCQGETFRFFGFSEYQLLESRGIWIYSREQLAGNKNMNTITVFYFSLPNGAIKRLTREDLKSAFPQNHQFHDSLDALIRSDDGLSDYDTFHKMYRINHILEMNQ